MRRFLVFALLAGLAVFQARDYVASGKLLAQLDAQPHRRGTATALFVLARYYDIFNEPKQALTHYQRVVDRYPDSRYGRESFYGVANCLERLKKYGAAIAAYEVYLKKYPKGKYSQSVYNNINILKGR